MKRKHIRSGLLFPVLTAFLIFSILYVVSIGTTPIDIKTVYRVMADQIFFSGAQTAAGAWDKSI